MGKPRVLVLGLNYAPERTGIAPYTTGMAVGLSSEFDVEVVTVNPHYPEWRVADGYGGWRRREVIDGVSVNRLRHYVPGSPTGVSRILSEGTYAARVLAPGVTRPDVIVAVTPALTPVASAMALGRRWDVPVGVVVQDLYSKAMVELGLLGGRVDRSVLRFERSLLRRSSGVVAIHESMATVIERDYDVAPDRLTVIPNWTHVSPPTGDRDVRRKELGWDDGVLTVVHAGNMGTKQGLEHLIPVARLVDERGLPIKFVLIGDGGQLPHLQERARGLRSLQFLPALPDDTFMDTLAAADVLLLHEKPGVKEMCVPSKLTSYFAAGRPVIAVTEADSAAAVEVERSGAGVLVTPRDAPQLVHCLRGMTEASMDQMGEKGRVYARGRLEKATALQSYRSWVAHLISLTSS